MNLKRKIYVIAWLIAPLIASMVILIPCLFVSAFWVVRSSFVWSDVGVYFAIYIITMLTIYIFYAFSSIVAVPVTYFLIQHRKFNRTTVPICGALVGLSSGSATLLIDTSNLFFPIAGLLMGFTTAWCFWFLINKAALRDKDRN